MIKQHDDFFKRSQAAQVAAGQMQDVPIARSARKPLTDWQIREIDELVWKELSWEEKTFGQFALKLARAIERAHGIGE